MNETPVAPPANLAAEAATARTHHPLSPSQLQTLEYCPCWQNRHGTSEKAEKGTRQHGVAESMEDDLTLTDDEALAAAECIDFVNHHKNLLEEDREREIYRRVRVTLPNAGQAPDPAAIRGMVEHPDEVLEIKEEYLPIDNVVFTGVPLFNAETGETKKQEVVATTAGFIDHGLISWDRTRGILFDWKFGAWAVEDAKNNLQGIAYTLGLFRKFPSLQTVTFFFKQPAIDKVTSATWARKDCPDLYLRVRAVVERAIAARRKGDFSDAKPSTPGCLFCAHVGRCPAVAQFACKVGAKFHPLKIPANITPSMLQDPQNTSLGLQLSQVMAVWAQAFRSQVSDRVIRRDGAMPEGYRIETRSEREVADPVKFREVALHHVPEAEYQKILPPPTFGDLEQVVNDAAPRGMKKASVEALRAELLESGAVKRGLPYSFLKVATSEKDKNTQNEETK